MPWRVDCEKRNCDRNVNSNTRDETRTLRMSPLERPQNNLSIRADAILAELKVHWLPAGGRIVRHTGRVKLMSGISRGAVLLVSLLAFGDLAQTKIRHHSRNISS